MPSNQPSDSERSLRPLYSGAQTPRELPARAHAGLWFDKFCDQWAELGANWPGLAEPKSGDRGSKQNWLATLAANLQVAGRFGPAVIGDAKLLSEIVWRTRALVSARNGVSHELASSSRVVTGMGNPNPIENALRWHPCAGVPYIPGTSLKGLARAWAESVASRADVDRVFGPEESPLATGSVTFLDAAPLDPVRLEADVMTPHYAPYYQRGDVPGDWCEPKPIPFLTIAPNQRFFFAAIPRRAPDQNDARRAFDWLTEALVRLGVGAKTAVGYGRFAIDQAIDEPPAVSVESKKPRYKTGDHLAATRTEDPKGRGRAWFEADDGFGGTLVGVAPPLALGQTIQLEVANVNQPPGYNFRLPRQKPASVDPYGQKPPKPR